jgi:cysteinyl-tRNA synthetase
LQRPPEDYLQGVVALGNVQITAHVQSRVDGAISVLSREQVQAKIDQRDAARKAKNFGESDHIRDELLAAGIVLEDGPGGTTWRRR